MNDIDLLQVEELYSLIVQLKTLRTMGGLKLESNHFLSIMMRAVCFLRASWRPGLAGHVSVSEKFFQQLSYGSESPQSVQIRAAFG